MEQPSPAIKSLYAQIIELRGHLGAIANKYADPNVERMIDDLRRQHGRDAGEFENLFTEVSILQTNVEFGDGAAGDQRSTLESVLCLREMTGVEAFASVETAEAELIASYDSALITDSENLGISAVLRRQRVALSDALQRLATLSGVNLV